MAEKKEEKKEGEAAEAGAPKKSKKKLIIIVAAVLVLAIGGGAFMFLGKKEVKPEDGEHAEAEPEQHYETVALDSIIVNLSENASFLKVKMILEYDPKVVLRAKAGHGGGGGYGGGGAGGEGEKDGGLPGVLGEKEPNIRDAIIRVMSSKKAEEVLTKDGKEQLKQELIEAINEATGLDEPAITNIFFVEFVIQ